MRGEILGSVFFGSSLTIVAYCIGEHLKKKYKNPIVNPILISMIIIITILSFFNIDFKEYNNGAQYISYFLTPATVCLAVPLYEELQHLKDNWLAIMAGIISGMLSSSISILIMSYLFELDHQQYVTLLPKSITVAIGMGVSEKLNGIVSITIAIIIITGIIGSVFGETVLHIFRIKHPIAKGVAFGSSAHALGTAKAMEIGELEGAISGLALAVSGVLTVVVATVFAGFL